MGCLFNPDFLREVGEKIGPRKGFDEHYLYRPHRTIIRARADGDPEEGLQANVATQLRAALKGYKDAKDFFKESGYGSVIEKLLSNIFDVGREEGFMNKLIDWLPTQIHLPYGYKWCGPGTEATPKRFQLV